MIAEAFQEVYVQTKKTNSNILGIIVSQSLFKKGYIAYMYRLKENPANAVLIKSINFSEEDNGKYQILFTVPIGLNKVIVTTNCKYQDYVIIDLNDINEIVKLCWRCYDTPVKSPVSLIPGDMVLKDRGTRQLVSDIDNMIKKLGKEINFDKYVKIED